MLNHFVVREGKPILEEQKVRSFYAEPSVERGVSLRTALEKKGAMPVDLRSIGVIQLSRGYPGSVIGNAHPVFDGFGKMWPDHLFWIALPDGRPVMMSIVIHTMDNLWQNPIFVSLTEPLGDRDETEHIRFGMFTGWEKMLFQALTLVVQASGGADADQNATLSKIVYARPAIVSAVLEGAPEELVTGLSPFALGLGASVLKVWRDEDALDRDASPPAQSSFAPEPSTQASGTWARLWKRFTGT